MSRPSKPGKVNIFESYEGRGSLWVDGDHIANVEYRIGTTWHRHLPFGGELIFRKEQGFRLHITQKAKAEGRVILRTDEGGRFVLGSLTKTWHKEIAKEGRVLKYDRNSGAMRAVLERIVEGVEVKVEFYDARPADAPPPVAQETEADEPTLADRLQWHGPDDLSGLKLAVLETMGG